MRYLLFGLVFVAASTARAQQVPDASASAEDSEASIEELPTAVEALRSDDEAQIHEGIDALVRIDGADAVAPLIERVRDGLPDAILRHALEALRQLAEPDAAELLIELTRHRRPEVRQRAYVALAALDDPRVETALLKGLTDPHPRVRGTSATQLGEVGSPDAIPTLFVAFERGVTEAAAAIGTLGDSDALLRFDTFLGARPLSIMLSGYRRALARQDVDSRTRTRIIDRLASLSTPAVRRFLSEYLARIPRAQRALRRRVEEAIETIPERNEARPTVPLSERSPETQPSQAQPNETQPSQAGQ